MVKFLTQEWIDEFKTIVNSNQEYAEAAKTWEGDFLFVVEGVGEEPVFYYVDLWHGKAKDCYLVTEDKKTPDKVEFEWKGDIKHWKALIEGKLDPIKGLMTRKFKLKGNKGKILRASKAAKVLVACASKVPTEF
ncbi:MAG: SCP2 sterol-binding domain-containing protein [Candidatus Hodarchaeales archaeon]